MEHVAAWFFVYARMRRCEDNCSSRYQAMTTQPMYVNVRLSSDLSFMNPALVSMKKKSLQEYIRDARVMDMPDVAEKEKALRKLKKAGLEKKTLKLMGRYDFMLEGVMRYKRHVLSPDEEKLLAMAGQVTAAPKDIFGMLNDADLKFGQVKDAQGNDVNLTHVSYIVLIQSPDCEVRHRAYDRLYGVYKDYTNTISTGVLGNRQKGFLRRKGEEVRSRH